MNGCVNTIERLPAFLTSSAFRLLVFGGKGGVGKTTCSAATALRLAVNAPETQYLVVSTDPAHSLKCVLGDSSLPPNLDMLEINAQESLERFKESHHDVLRTIAERGTFLDHEDISQVLDLSLPGLDEVMAFNEIAKLASGGRYSCIIVDTAPTGHTVRFLSLPEMLRKWLRALDAMLAKHRYLSELYSGGYDRDETDVFLDEIAAMTQGLAALLADRTRCNFVPVMLPEAMSIEETRRFLSRLRDANIRVRDIVVNRLRPSPNGCPVCRAVGRGQQKELRRLLSQFSEYALWEVPLQEREPVGAEHLLDFWTATTPAHVRGKVAENSSALPIRTQHPVPLPGPDASHLLFAGKGGVGKTTLACATALRLSQAYPREKILLLSTDPAHSLSDCLMLKVGPRETAIRPGLHAVEIDAEKEFRRLRALYVREVRGFFETTLKQNAMSLEFDSEVAERLMDLSPPGLDEVMALTRAMELLEEGRYDRFILDTAPTGHFIRLLELPGLVEEWLRVLFGLFLKYKNVLRLPRVTQLLVTTSKRIKLLRAILADPRRGQLFAVSALTQVAFEQTQRLYRASGQTGVRVAAIFLNQATPWSACDLCRRVNEGESKVREQFDARFRSIPKTIVYHGGQVRGLDRLTELGNALYQ